jgi:hypothetical protein
MLTIIESEARTWAVAATNGDLSVYSRERPGEWVEVSLSDDAEQIGDDGSVLLEALYEQQNGLDQGEEEPREDDDVDEPVAEEDEEPVAEEDEDEPVAEEDEEPAADDEEDVLDEEDEPEEPEEDERPRRRRGRTKAKTK